MAGSDKWADFKQEVLDSIDAEAFYEEVHPGGVKNVAETRLHANAASTMTEGRRHPSTPRRRRSIAWFAIGEGL